MCINIYVGTKIKFDLYIIYININSDVFQLNNLLKEYVKTKEIYKNFSFVIYIRGKILYCEKNARTCVVAPASISEKVQVTISKDVILRLMPT